MKYGKILIFGALLASGIPSALATPLKPFYGELDGSGKGVITSTGLTLTNRATTGTKSPKGAVVGDGSGGFSTFTNGTAFFFDFNNPNYLFTFSTATALHPVELLQVIESGKTLSLFLTNIDLTSIMVGTNAVGTGCPTGPRCTHAATTGAFSGEGYVTEAGFLDTPVDFQLTNTGSGAGEKVFSFEIISQVPEPGSFALLGTGMFSVAGMVRRRFRGSVV